MLRSKDVLNLLMLADGKANLYFVWLVSFLFYFIYSNYIRCYCDWWYCHQVRCYSSFFSFIVIAKIYGQMLLWPSLFVLMVHALPEPVGTSMSWRLAVIWLLFMFKCLFVILVEVLVTWPTPHPRYMAAGICQYSYSEISHWLWLAWSPWWFWQFFGLPCPLCWNYLQVPHDLWC